jgi:hypothetical protein
MAFSFQMPSKNTIIGGLASFWAYSLRAFHFNLLASMILLKGKEPSKQEL